MKDPAFLYYDGDAAKDVAHMNRLERGCYLDIIHAQRKRGHLSVEDVKKVLGKDFESCWSAVEWVMIKDGEGKYFIEWLENSIIKRKKHSEHQKSNVAKRWDDEYQTDTKLIPNSYQTDTK